MKKLWNKETYNDEGEFTHIEDWGINVPDEGFTEEEPIGLEHGVPPKQHWDEETNKWVLDDTSEDAGKLRSMTYISQIDIVNALDKLGELDKLDALMNNSMFKLAWSGAGGLVNLADPITVAALEQGSIDIDVVKRKIIELANTE